MKFKTSSTLSYTANSAATIILNIHPQKTKYQTLTEENFTITPSIQTTELTESSGENRLVRLDIFEKTEINITYSAIAETSMSKFDWKDLDDVPLSQFDRETLGYVSPSRYCQSDKLYRLADKKFGMIDNGYMKVTAICDWIYENVQYLSGSTNSQTSAFDTLTERAGVCRDFAHLGIALCRALTIPARYFTGYSYLLKPADYHACFEAYLGGRWIIFDATRLAPLNGLVRIATGRDAADAPFASLFGDIYFNSSTVDCQLLDDTFSPLVYNSENLIGISYE
jgi:transglutaminase-like putative cysteine protease